MNASYRRVLVASVLLLALLAFFLLIDELLALRNSMTFQSFAGVKGEKLTTGIAGKIASPESLYSIIVEQYEQPLPDFFQEEFFEVEGASEYFVGADGGVVGVHFKSNASEVLLQITEELREKGWAVIESGSKTQVSFVKSSGRYSYAFLECFDDSLGCLAVFTLGLGGQE